jgi:hypothetical protein
MKHQRQLLRFEQIENQHRIGSQITALMPLQNRVFLQVR